MSIVLSDLSNLKELELQELSEQECQLVLGGGDVVDTLGACVGGATAGAVVGSVVPGVGTVAGAVAGCRVGMLGQSISDLF